MFDWLYRKAADKQFFEARSLIDEIGITEDMAFHAALFVNSGVEFLSGDKSQIRVENLGKSLATLFGSRRKSLVRRCAEEMYIAAQKAYRLTNAKDVAAAGGLVASVFHYGAIIPSISDFRYDNAAMLLSEVLEK